MNRVLVGAVAGAAGTAVIDVVTNGDVLLRGREPSEVPKRVVQGMEQRLGVITSSESVGRRWASRESGLAGLLGDGVGIGFGVAYALLPRRWRRLPGWVSGPVVGMTVMAVTDSSATALGATDPRSWSPSGWLADILPHVIYGAVVTGVVRVLDPPLSIDPRSDDHPGGREHHTRRRE